MSQQVTRISEQCTLSVNPTIAWRWVREGVMAEANLVEALEVKNTIWAERGRTDADHNKSLASNLVRSQAVRIGGA